MPRKRLARLSSRERRSAVILAFALLISLTGAAVVTPARAADVIAPAATEAERPRQFTIPAEPLADAVKQFQEQSGLQVQVDPALIAGLQSTALNGMFRPADALRRLLSAAPVTVRFGQDANGLAVNGLKTIGGAAVTQLHTFYVTATPKYGKFTQPIVDTPQTLVEVPQTVLKEQNVTSLRDALRNVSGISLAAGEGGSQGDALTIRGFDAKDDIYLDGIRDFGNYYRDPFNLESVEVIMGPASMLAGHGEGGGLVNQVSKTAHLGNSTDADLSTGSAGMNRLTLDDNIQLSSTEAIRFNAVGMDGGTAGRDVTTNKRVGFAGTYSAGLGTSTRFTLSAFDQNDDGIPDYGIPYVNDRPATGIDRSNFYGLYNSDRIEDNNAVYTAAIDHDLKNGDTIHSGLRFASYSRDFDATNATQPTPEPIPGTPDADITVPRASHHRNGVETFMENQTYIKGQTGDENGIGQHWMAGFELTRETSHESSISATGLPAANLADPNPYTLQVGTFTLKSDNHTTADTLAGFVADSISFGKHFDFDAGLRADTFAAENTEYVSKTNATQDVRRLSPQAAIVFKPRSNGSIYISYDTSFQPSADALSLTSAQLVAPANNATFEVGSKWLLNGGRTTVSGSIFNSVMGNAHITEPDGSVEPVGTERSQGAQFQLQGHVGPHWEVTGGYTLLETRVLSYALATQPGVVGTRIPNAPTGSASIWSTYDFPKRWKLGLGGSGLSQRQASIGVDTATGVPILVPGYVRVDGLLSYRFSPRASIALNGYNLLNKYYLDEIHPDHVIPGAARSFAINVDMKTGK